ncbi:hypothetical protein JPH1_53220 (plasmid) [Mycobacterium avium subsp. hominissuis]|uniref:Uncharacterized protein n=1 Tax=Mycobacterium avium subsp. hominissuis TaxID=439334 RepID=A0AAI8STB6_MYCAV|nr:hypothetical protein JPH1_53220 [Mycobacterium avium subsp. hominissuis]
MGAVPSMQVRATSSALALNHRRAGIGRPLDRGHVIARWDGRYPKLVLLIWISNFVPSVKSMTSPPP